MTVVKLLLVEMMATLHQHADKLGLQQSDLSSCTWKVSLAVTYCSVVQVINEITCFEALIR